VDTLGAVGPGSNSVVVNVPIPDTTPPSQPTNFRVTANSGGAITLAWNSSTDNQTAAGDLWYILTSPLDQSDYYTWTQTNPYTTGFFDPGTTHEVYIQAIDEAGNASAKVGPLTFTVQ
jgi:chitinase